MNWHKECIHIFWLFYHTKPMLIRFLIYGLCGWMMEILWTGLHSLLQKDFSLMGQTSLWMFPIYGMAIFLEPICLVLQGFPLLIRGGVYMICIFGGEYVSGLSLKKLVGVCPWDYSQSAYHYQGLIRLDYAPVWFMVGIFFEQLFLYLTL